MPQLAKSLAAEARRSKVGVHICSPGGTLLSAPVTWHALQDGTLNDKLPHLHPIHQLTAGSQASVGVLQPGTSALQASARCSSSPSTTMSSARQPCLLPLALLQECTTGLQAAASWAAEPCSAWQPAPGSAAGMVATDLLLQGVSSPRAAQIVNILAEDAHVVAAWLCPRMRGVTGQGKYFRWETCAW